MTRRCPLLLDGRALLDADRLIRAGLADRRACYELWFAKLPAHAGFLIVGGVESLLDTLSRPLVGRDEIESALRAGVCSGELAARLTRLSLTVDIDAMADGAVAFPRGPVATVEGPFLETVLVGTILRATIQKETAIATRTARLHLAGAGDAIVDGSSAHVATPEASLVVARAAHVGGANATTNVLAATTFDIPFRGTARVDLGALGQDRGARGPSERAPLIKALAPVPTPSTDSWGDLPDNLAELGLGDDEEAMLIEAKRLGMSASGWIARGLADADGRALPMRYELVALEQDGAWSPRRGSSGRAAVIPGRKMVVRYTDDEGRVVADVVHLSSERMQAPKSLGAKTLAPLARPVMRGGRTLESPELPSVGRERALTARAALPPELTHLRSPPTYPVRLSPGIIALRDPPKG